MVVGFDRHVVVFKLLLASAHRHGRWLNLDAPLSYSQECAAERTEHWAYQSNAGTSQINSWRFSRFIALLSTQFYTIRRG